MDLTFKASMLKEWRLLDDRIIYGGREILFTDIQSAKLFSKSTFASNGVIQIIVGGKFINLAYPHKQKVDGKKL